MWVGGYVRPGHAIFANQILAIQGRVDWFLNRLLFKMYFENCRVLVREANCLAMVAFMIFFVEIAGWVKAAS